MLGMVKNFQDMYFNDRDQSTKKGYSSPSFTKISNSYGIESYRVDNAQNLDGCINMMTNHTGPLLLEIIMNDASECRPRLAYGSKLDEQHPKPDNV